MPQARPGDPAPQDPTAAGGAGSRRPGSTVAGRYRLDAPRHTDLPGAERWTATDTILARPVTVTLVTGDRGSAVLDAARRASLVVDPRLSRILDVGTADGTGYVVSAAVEGRSLAALAAQGPLAPDQARAVVGEVAAALEIARRRGVHHLALRPEVVVVDPTGRVVLEGLAVDGELIGAATGGAHAMTRADAVGLVRVLYAALTGRWPAALPGGEAAPVRTFEEWSAARTGDPRAAGPAPVPAGLPDAPVGESGPLPPVDLVATVPADLDTLCAVTLGPHDDGPHSPGELVRELEPWRAVRGDEIYRTADAGRWHALPGAGEATTAGTGSGGVRGGGVAPAAGAATAVGAEPAAAPAGASVIPGLGAAGTLAAGTAAAGAAVAAATTGAGSGDTTAPLAAGPTAAGAAADRPGVGTSGTARPQVDAQQDETATGTAPVPGAATDDAPPTRDDGTATTPSPAPHSAPPTGSSPMSDDQPGTTPDDARPDDAAPGTGPATAGAAGATAAATGGGVARQSVRSAFGAAPSGPGSRVPGTPPSATPAAPPSVPPARSGSAAEPTPATAGSPDEAVAGISSLEPSPAPAPAPSPEPVDRPAAPVRRTTSAFGRPTSSATTPPQGVEAPEDLPAAIPPATVAPAQPDPVPTARVARTTPPPARPAATAFGASGAGASGGSGGDRPDWDLPFAAEQPSSAAADRRFDPTRWVLGAVALAVVVGLVVAIGNVLKPFGGGADDTAGSPVATASAPPVAEAPADGAGDGGGEAEAPAAAPPVVVGVTSLDSSDADGEHEELVARLLDGDPATTWYTHTYNRPDFAGFKDAVGLVITLQEPATVTSVTLDGLGNGGSVEVRATDGANPTAGDVLAAGALAAPQTVLTLSQPTQTQSLVLWFTSLSQTPDGANKIELSSIAVS